MTDNNSKDILGLNCWWFEGGLCYVEPVVRNAEGRSSSRCNGKCKSFLGKRQKLEQYIPSNKLVIMSEVDHNRKDT